MNEKNVKDIVVGLAIGVVALVVVPIIIDGISASTNYIYSKIHDSAIIQSARERLRR